MLMELGLDPIRGLPKRKAMRRECSSFLAAEFDQIVMVVAHFVKWRRVQTHLGIQYKRLARAGCVC